jgi:hypothetical protein
MAAQGAVVQLGLSERLARSVDLQPLAIRWSRACDRWARTGLCCGGAGAAWYGFLPLGVIGAEHR